MPSDRIHLSVDEARGLGERALRGIGYDAEDARIIADHVIDAALCGYEYSGLAKLLNIPEHRRFPLPRRKMRILHETEVSALYDGGNNVGMLAMYHAARGAVAGCLLGLPQDRTARGRAEERRNGSRHGEVVQRDQGFWLHHPR